MTKHALAGIVILCLVAYPAYSLEDVDDLFDSSENLLETYFSHLGESIFGIPDLSTGDEVSKWSPEMLVNPEELGKYMEGDILFPTDGLSRNGLRAKSSRWPDATVYYRISPAFTYREQAVILAAFDDYHNKTCVRFVPWSGQRDCLRIVKGNTGCWSSVGRLGGCQDLNLQSPGCLSQKGTAIHELMHALGFNHEHTRWERDRHVSIRWGNIQKGRENNFQKASKKTTDALGVDYDYRSVMHYSQYAFSANGQPTIEPMNKIKGMKLGQREGFSRGDIKKINRMYKCNNKKRTK
ncbi:zinc metalloproteinase nas-13-like [Bacillus rossius redtenbacheri]|uniref:zinc metalloproteinase nas-13-like n=1 Tax=Bacillus rossius redtenbacheri TaxID=93214 RepID=UPI002FDD876D